MDSERQIWYLFHKMSNMCDIYCFVEHDAGVYGIYMYFPPANCVM